LSEAFDKTINRIGNRLNTERGRVKSVSERVSVCNGKIQLIVGSNRATTVFSTAKFPATKKLPNSTSILISVDEVC
jgi:WAS family protein 1